jgi:hypothetical protein
MKAFKQKLFIFFTLLLVNSLSAFAQEYVYVSVEKTDLKNGIGFFAEKVAQINYGTRLIILENTIEDKWIKVAEYKNQEVFGWILSANVTKRKVVNLIDKTQTSSKELSLAGKGFSQGKVNSGNVDYDALNTIENFSTNLQSDKLKNFIKEGNLKGE